MITNKNNVAHEDADSLHEQMDQEIKSRLFELREELKEKNQLMEEVNHFKNSGLAEIYANGLNEEYQKFFKKATETDDANIAKSNLDKMKGVGMAMGMLSKTIKAIEDDIEAILLNIQQLETGRIV